MPPLIVAVGRAVTFTSAVVAFKSIDCAEQVLLSDNEVIEYVVVVLGLTLKVVVYGEPLVYIDESVAVIVVLKVEPSVPL